MTCDACGKPLSVKNRRYRVIEAQGVRVKAIFCPDCCKAYSQPLGYDDNEPMFTCPTEPEDGYVPLNGKGGCDGNNDYSLPVCY